jgi:hypothetical protein
MYWNFVAIDVVIKNQWELYTYFAITNSKFVRIPKTILSYRQGKTISSISIIVFPVTEIPILLRKEIVVLLQRSESFDNQFRCVLLKLIVIVPIFGICVDRKDISE